MGRPNAKLIGKRFADVLPGTGDATREMLQRVVDEDSLIDRGEVEYGDDEVERKIFSVKAFPLPGRRVAVTFEDVTDIARARLALQTSEARFRGAFGSASVGMSLTSLDGQFVQVNERLAEILGYTVPELMEMTFRDVSHPDDVERDAAYVAEMRAGLHRVGGRAALHPQGRGDRLGSGEQCAHRRARRTSARRLPRPGHHAAPRGGIDLRRGVRAVGRPEADRRRRAATRRAERERTRLPRSRPRGGADVDDRRPDAGSRTRRRLARVHAGRHHGGGGDAQAPGRRAAPDRVRRDRQRPPRPSHRSRTRPFAPERSSRRSSARRRRWRRSAGSPAASPTTSTTS